MKILRSFSSRTQAVELLRELEDFDLDPPLRGEAGSVRPSQPDSSGSSDTGSSSTASYDARTRRAMAPPPPLHASAHSAARSSRSHRPPSVAPPLPGYGPPRTRADAVRAPPPREPPPQQHRQQYSDDEDSYSSSSSVAGARDVYHPAAASVPPSVRSRTALPSRIAPPSTSQAGPLRSVAGSVAGVPPLPLTAGNLRAATSRAPSVAPAPAPVPVRALTPAPAQPPPPLAPPQLDAALERIQLSLTALHERLSLLESSGTPASSPGGAGAGAPLALVSETVRRLLEAVHLRRAQRGGAATSPSAPLGLRTRPQQQRSSLAGLVGRLVLALLASARRLAGDAAVLLALAVLIGRLRGVDVLGLVARRVLGTGKASRVQ
ncbi:hypothetical protein JCM10449v2_003421 [Rhodotorula kratochvilovae]